MKYLPIYFFNLVHFQNISFSILFHAVFGCMQCNLYVRVEKNVYFLMFKTIYDAQLSYKSYLFSPDSMNSHLSQVFLRAVEFV